ncbi:antirestriction protein [Kibdelosporangium banguiense]|uniref:Antirestriction protein n=1 Tax=Kibdelosporangium banguiense TaxID=1365924 RepID=A0ABS4TE35_9PSEU|nr:antirestriction protein ArdA [Kibdelosporangium banguiense]MBP2322677.1 antirestriction protein [Kibdelosporangium banguiense]
MEGQPHQPNGGEYQRQPERPGANSYGTNDPERQAEIKQARTDAAEERRRDRARLERLVELGMTPDDAEALIEFDHYVSDHLRPQALEAREPFSTAAEIEAALTYLPRIEVVDTASHERGIRHGLWIEADQEPDELEADIRAMLDSSPTPEATAWAIHATEGFAGLDLRGYTDTRLIAQLAKGVAEHGAAYAAWVGIVGTDNHDLLERFTDFHVGSYDSAEAWAREAASDLEWPQQLDNALDPMLRRFVVIDYTRFARDARQSWDVVQGVDSRTHVFMR